MIRFAPVIVSAAFVVLVAFAPIVFVEAQLPAFQGPIVPCGTEASGNTGPFACDSCKLLALAQNVINFTVFLATVVAVLMFVYAGFLYITAGGDTGKIKRAHGIFMAVFIGFIIVLAAWLFVDFLMKSFLDETKFGPWNKILCP